MNAITTARPAAMAGRAAGRLTALLAVAAAVGLLPLLTGRDPALAVLRARSVDREPDAAALDSVRAELGLDAGPLGLLGHWLSGLVRGDLGRSWVSGEPIGAALARASAVSLTLGVFAALVAACVGAALVARPLWHGITGKPSASRGRTAALLAAVPEFLLASALLLVFAVHLRLLPTSGWNDLRHAVLPAVALGVPAGAVLGAIAADAVRGAVAEPWLRTWQAAGLSRSRLAAAVARRAASVVSGQLALLVAGLLGGGVAVELVFAVPGVGRMALAAALAQDVPVVQACVLVILVLGVAAGAVGALGQRLLLGPAFTDGRLTAPPAVRRARSGRLLPLLLCGAAGAVVVAGLLRDPLSIDLTARLTPPSVAHPFGRDALGRDVLARLGHGTLTTALLTVVVSAAALVVGLAVGVARRGGVAIEIVNALPPAIAALLVAAVVGPGTAGAAIAVAGVLWAPLAAHTRSLAAEQYAAQHLEAARAVGASERWLLTRHVLPAVLPPVLRGTLVRMPGVALALASLGFLGLGARQPTPEWGLLLAEALPYAERAPWAVLAPALAMALLGVGALALGDRLMSAR